MASQLVTSGAHKGIDSGAGYSLAGRCSGMQNLCTERFLPGSLSLRLSHPRMGRISPCRHDQGAPRCKFELRATSHFGFRWTFVPFDGMTRRIVWRSRRWNSCNRNGCGILRRKSQISAISNFEATGLGPTGSASGNQEPDAIILDVEGMKSGNCAAAVRRLLAADKRVRSVAVSLTTNTAAIHLKPSASVGTRDTMKVGSELASRVTDSGFTSRPRPAGKAESFFRKMREEISRKRKELLRENSGQVAFAWALSAFCFATHATHLLRTVGIHGVMGGTISSLFEKPIYEACIASVALLGPGRDLLVDGVKAMWRKSPNMNSLVGVGAGVFCAMCAASLVFPRLNGGASFLDVPVMLLAFIFFGRAMDGQARAEASRGSHDLLTGLPSRLRLVVPETGTAEPTEDRARLTQGLVVGVDLEQLRPGDYVLILPGEVIPVDGTVIEGRSVIDESVLVGEPLSVHKMCGNNVSAGTINKEGPLTVEVTAIGPQSAVSTILKHVEEAQIRDSTVQRITDVLSGSSAFSVLSLSAATFFFWYFIGAYALPDVLFKEAAAPGISAFLPSLRFATDVLVVGSFSTLGLAAQRAGLRGESVGSRIKRLTRREVQEPSAGVVSGLSYKDEETVAQKHVAGSPPGSTAAAEAGTNCEDTLAKKDDSGLVTDVAKGEELGSSYTDTLALEGDGRSFSDESRRGQPDASCGDVVGGEDHTGLSHDGPGRGRLGRSGEDIVVRKDDTRSVFDYPEGEQLSARDDVGVTRTYAARTPTYNEETEESCVSATYEVPDMDDVKPEEPAARGGGLIAEKDSKSLTLEFITEDLSAREPESSADNDVAESQTVHYSLEEHNASETETVAEIHDRALGTLEFEAEKHRASKQEMAGEKDDAVSVIDETNFEEQSYSEQDFFARKDDVGLLVVERGIKELEASELDSVSEKGNELSENIESKYDDGTKFQERSCTEQDFMVMEDDAELLILDSRVEEHKASDLDSVSMKDNEAWANVQAKCEGSSANKGDLIEERDDPVSSTVQSKAEDNSASEQELVAKTGDEEPGVVGIKTEEFMESCVGNEDKHYGYDEGERPAKKERKRRTTVSNSGRKQLGSEEHEAETKTKKRKKKDPTAPKRGLSAFMCFSKLVRKDLKESRPELSFPDIGRVVGDMWQNMSVEEKAPFEAMAEADRARYEREMQKWRGGGDDEAPKE